MTSDIQKYCGNRCREDARRERIAIREWAGDQLDELEAEYGRDKVVSIWRWDTLQVDKERDMRWCGSGDL